MIYLSDVGNVLHSPRVVRLNFWSFFVTTVIGTYFDWHQDIFSLLFSEQELPIKNLLSNGMESIIAYSFILAKSISIIKVSTSLPLPMSD